MADNLSLYPKYESLEECFSEAKRHLPIYTVNELQWLFEVIRNQYE